MPPTKQVGFLLYALLTSTTWWLQHPAAVVWTFLTVAAFSAVWTLAVNLAERCAVVGWYLHTTSRMACVYVLPPPPPPPQSLLCPPLLAVKQRIRAIKNIGKITKAMKMVAASKMRNAQTAVEHSRGIVEPFVRLFGDYPGRCDGVYVYMTAAAVIERTGLGNIGSAE